MLAEATNVIVAALDRTGATDASPQAAATEPSAAAVRETIRIVQRRRGGVPRNFRTRDRSDTRMPRSGFEPYMGGAVQSRADDAAIGGIGTEAAAMRRRVQNPLRCNGSEARCNETFQSPRQIRPRRRRARCRVSLRRLRRGSHEGRGPSRRRASRRHERRPSRRGPRRRTVRAIERCLM